MTQRTTRTMAKKVWAAVVRLTGARRHKMVGNKNSRDMRWPPLYGMLVPHRKEADR